MGGPPPRSASPEALVPDCHAMLQRCVGQESPTTTRLEVIRADLIHSCCLATEEPPDYLSDFGFSDE